jgi:serine/threonine-protein kinase
VVDHGQDGNLTYIAMEFLAGHDLLRVLSDDWPLPFGRIIDIVMQTLAPLSVAHAQGIVHRDLKPENIMVLKQQDDDGNPRDLIKVCDFGIAKILDPRGMRTGGGGMGRALTTTGSLVGTPEYMSPEQARGDALDARSDLYSVGVILYQLLTGRVPFMAETALGVVLKQVSDMPEPPSRYRPETPVQLEAICMRALRKGVHERYQTAKEMRSELRALLLEIGGVRISDESLPMFPSAPRIRTGDPTLAVPGGAPAAQLASGVGAPVRVASDPNLVPSSPTPPFPLTQQAAGYFGTQTTATRNAPEPRKSSALVVLLGVLGAATLAAAMVLGAQAYLKGRSAPVAHGPDAQITELEPIVTDTTNGPAKPLPDPNAAPSGKATTWPSAKPNSILSANSAKVVGAPSAKPSATPLAEPPRGPTSATVAPPPPAPTPEAPAAPYDATRAYVEVGGMVFSSGVSDKAVRSLLTAHKPSILACYQKGLKAKGGPVQGVLTLNLSVSGEGKIRSCLVQGPDIPETSRCVQGVVTGQTLPQSAIEGPGGGTAEASVILHP